MASRGIKDRVAIVGMGCTAFGEHWDRSADDLLVDAVEQCLATTPTVTKDDIDAYWLGTMNSGQSGLVLSKPLGIEYKPVTRVENFCATGSESFRNAAYAVASGAYDVVMAVGVEKLKDTGFSGLVRSNVAGDGTAPEETLTAPAAFSLLDPAYCKKYGVDPQDMRDAMTHVAWKNHYNGARNERAQYRKEIPKEKIAAGASWVDEYGSVDDPTQRAFLESISPYGQLRRGTHYPEPFVWTTTKDDRVGPQHARKFAARLAEFGDPYLFYEAGEGGHGAGADREEQAHTSALEYTYLMRRLM